MKKNAMLKIAAVVLCAVLLTTCAISTTFAKYTTSGSGDIKFGRVAHFGFTVTAVANELFDTEYATGGKTYVQSSGSDLVLAPGTKNDVVVGFTVAQDGKPEVAYAVTGSIDLDLNDWVVGTDSYFPVVIKIGGDAVDYNIDDDLADIEKAVEAAYLKAIFGDVSVTYDETNGSTYTSDTYAPGSTAAIAEEVIIGWEWAFETGDGDPAKAANNIKDTALGNAGTKATIDLTCSIAIEQVGAGSSVNA